MATLKEILKYTYLLTFDEERSYDWDAILEVIVNSEKSEEDLIAQQLVTNTETKEDLMSWKDLFFMEAAEQKLHLERADKVLFETIKENPLFKENERFLSQLPKVTTELGRELLIDEMIGNKDADALIPDRVIENALKKKSREELRSEFEEWGEEWKQKEEVMFEKKILSDQEPATTRERKTFSLVKYLIAASVVGIIALIGVNMFTNDRHSVDKGSYATTTKKEILKDAGFGYVEKDSNDFIEVQTYNYNEAIASGLFESNKVSPNSYLFNNGSLTLILTDKDLPIELIELDGNELYLDYAQKFFAIDTSDNYRKLEKLNDTNIIERLERIIFENE